MAKKGLHLACRGREGWWVAKMFRPREGSTEGGGGQRAPQAREGVLSNEGW